MQKDSDRLFVFHTGRDDSWKAAGPLIPDLETALESWPHSVISLKGRLQSNLSVFLDRFAIDIVVLPEDFPRQGAVQIGSVADWVKQNVTKPFILMRPGAVRNEKLRLTTCEKTTSPVRTHSRGPSGAESELISGRRIAIAYPSFPVGVGLVELAKQLVLSESDEIYLVHCFNSQSRVIEGGQRALRQTKKVLKSLSLTKGQSNIVSRDSNYGETQKTMPTTAPSMARDYSGAVTEEAAEFFGARELDGFPKVHLDVVLRGDPRSTLATFCESERIDLLIISTRTGGRLYKTLSGGSVSAFLIDKAPCPCFVAPYKSLGLDQEDIEEVLTPKESSGKEVEWPIDSRQEEPLEGSSRGGTSPSEQGTSFSKTRSGTLDPTPAAFAALQAQIEERDRIIAELREEIKSLRLASARERDENTHDSFVQHKTY